MKACERLQAACLLYVFLCLCPRSPVSARSAFEHASRLPQTASHVLEGQHSGHCEQSAADRIAEQLAAARAANESFNSCPSTSWLQAYHSVKQTRGGVIVDIGSNKGYGLFQMLDTLLPELRLTPARLFMVLSQMKPAPAWGWCGGCSQCKVGPPLSEDTQRPQQLPDDPAHAVRVLSFEPSGRNFKALEYAKRSFFAVDDFTPETPIHWSIFKMAVANFSGTVQFPADCSQEFCRMKLDGVADGDTELMSSLETVPVITVDEIVAGQLLPQGHTTFDILQIDAQGFDPLVLQGADATLRAQRPAVVQFEYGWFGAWGFNTLQDIVHQMHLYGYICYLDGSPALTRLTGCWHDSFEFKMWAAVVCARAADASLVQAFDQLSFQADSVA